MHCLISNINCQAVSKSWESDLCLDPNDEANFAFLKQWIWWSFCKRKLVWPWKSWKQKIEFRVKTYVWKHQYKIDNEITLVFLNPELGETARKTSESQGVIRKGNSESREIYWIKKNQDLEKCIEPLKIRKKRNICIESTKIRIWRYIKWTKTCKWRSNCSFCDPELEQLRSSSLEAAAWKQQHVHKEGKWKSG